MLLCHRRDGNLWNLPGGGLERGEAPWDAIDFSFVCNVMGGVVTPTDEADKIEYLPLDRIPPNTSRKQVERIRDAATARDIVLKEQLGPSSWLPEGQMG